MLQYKWCKSHYLDASALVKLVADDSDEEPGRKALRDYHKANIASVYATSYSVAETLSVFKRKSLHKKISQEQYLKYVQDFLRTVIGRKNLRIDEVPILSVYSKAERLIKTYKIDFLDCLQIVTIMEGYFRHMVSDSQSILITADRDLAKAARAEGAKVWECTSEEAPRDVPPPEYLLPRSISKVPA
jgi:predicted nucleic acid-binding protein